MSRTIQVLVIESDRLNRVLMRGILDSVGMQVLDASSEHVGLPMLRAAPCDLVVTEWMSSGVTGETMIREWRRQFPELRVIALLSGQGGSKGAALLEEEQQLGVVRVLSKPVFRFELLSAIRELFPDWHPGDEDWAEQGL